MLRSYDGRRDTSSWLPTVPARGVRWDNRAVAAAVIPTWPRRMRSAASLLPVAYGIVALLVAAATRAPQNLGPTSYAGVSSAAYTADLVAGLGLLGAVALALLDAGSARIGGLASAAVVLVFASGWGGGAGGPALLRSLGAAGVPLLAGPLALLVADRLRVRRLVRGGVVVLGAGARARALVR